MLYDIPLLFMKIRVRSGTIKTLLQCGITMSFLCLAGSGFSQSHKKDSLENSIKTGGEDTNKVNALNSIARFTANDDLVKARGYANRAVMLANTLVSNGDISALKSLANSYHILGVICFYESNYPGALTNYFESLNIRKKISDKAGLAASYNNIAIIYKHQGNYAEAIKHHFSSLKIEEENGNKQAIGMSYNNIGIIYEEQDELEEAIKNYGMAIQIGREINDKEGMANAYNNLGIVYKKQKNYTEALANYFLALELRKEVGYVKGILGSYNNIASLYFAQGNYEEALKNHRISLSMAKASNNELSTAMSYINIGLVYSKQKKFTEAEKYLKDGLNYSISINNKQIITESYSALSSLYNDTKDYKKALDNFKLYVINKDSLLNNHNKEEIMRSAMQYEFEKQSAVAKVEQEKREAVQNEELKKKSAQVKLYIVICILTIILFVAIVLQMRNKRKTEKLKLENSLIDLEQKALRLQMNPHFIFNALNSIQGFITENNQASAKKYLSKFARLMRLIMENSAEKTVSLQNEIEVLNDYLELTSLRFSNAFTFTIEVDEKIDVSNAEIPPMLLQPFVENAVLHGIAAKESNGLIHISFLQKEGIIECTIEDNGVGRQKAMEQKPDAHKSTGMMVTEERLKVFGEHNHVKSKLRVIDLFDTFGNACGTKVILEIPMQLAWT